MFNNAIEQALAAKDKALTNIVKLGTVSSVSGGRAKVQHYGESTASGKNYTYIDGYIPEVGDVVAMLPQANTYIIIGKVCDTAAVEKYATKTYVDETFLPLEYKNKLEDGSKKLTLSGSELLPDANNDIKLGSSSKMLAEIYSKKFYADGDELRADAILLKSGGVTYSLILTVSSGTATLTPSSDGVFALGTSAKKLKEAWLGLFRGSWKSGQSTERQISWNSSNALLPDMNETVDLGTSSYHFKDVYIKKLIGAWGYNSNSGYLEWVSATLLAPSATNSIELGSSTKQFNKIYAKEIYVNGTAVSSDRRVKENIKDLEEKHLAFFKALRPVQFKYKEGDSGRTHTGFIAQEVEEAVKEAGMTSQDMAVVVKDPIDRYYLRYEEIISVQTKVIQDLMAKVESLEARITKLEGKGENK